MFKQYPYINFTDLNLDWLIKRMREVEDELHVYLDNAVIKFADPITWDITDQYTSMTVVVDSDGTAYISKQPVPVGIDITNTDYWLPIFNYDDNINKLMSNITVNARTTGVLPEARTTGSLVWYNGDLYTLTADLAAGSMVIPDTNATKIRLEDWIDLIRAALDQEIQDREDADTTLDGRIDQEILDRGAADTALSGRIDQEILDRGAADTALGGRITDVENAIAAYSNYIIKPEAFGAKGDGVTDDTTAIQDAVNDAALHYGTVWFQHGKTYVFTEIELYSNVRLYSDGGILKLRDNTFISSGTVYYMIDGYGSDNVILDSLIIDGNKTTNTDFLVGDAITVAGAENVIIKDCHLYNLPDSGIMFSNLSNSICINNRIDDCNDAGIYYNTGSGNSGFQNIVAFNRISNAGTSGIALKRVSQKALVIGNMIRDSNNGITLEQASSATDYSTMIMIEANRIYNVAVCGINLRLSAYCNVTGNIIEDFGNWGIMIEGNSGYNSVTGNIIISTDRQEALATRGGGIALLLRDNYAPTRNSFTGNTINCRDKVNVRPAVNLYCASTPGAQAARNIFTGNVIAGQTEGVKISSYFNQGILVANSIEGSYTNNSGAWVYDNNV